MQHVYFSLHMPGQIDLSLISPHPSIHPSTQPSIHPSICLDCGGAGFYPSSHWVRGRKAQMVCDTVNMSNVPSDVQQLWPHLISCIHSSEVHNKSQRGFFSLWVSSASACQLLSMHRINFSFLSPAFLHLCSVFLRKLILLTPACEGFNFFSHGCVYTQVNIFDISSSLLFSFFASRTWDIILFIYFSFLYLFKTIHAF